MNAEFPPYDPLGRQLNERFHEVYQQRVQDIVDSFGAPGGRPVLVAIEDSILIMKDGVRRQVTTRPTSYHQLKALCHAFFARMLGAEEPELQSWSEAYLREVAGQLPPQAAEIAARVPDTLQPGVSWEQVGELMEAAFEAAARIELECLEREIGAWWQQLLPEERSRCAIVISSSHQARAQRLSVQYFEKLTGRRTGVGACGEDGLIVVENESDFDGLLPLLARHFLDQEVAAQLFGDRFRLQIDLLAPAAQKLLS